MQVLLLSPQGSQGPVAAHPCLCGSRGGTQSDGTVPLGEVWGLAFGSRVTEGIFTLLSAIIHIHSKRSFILLPLFP